MNFKKVFIVLNLTIILLFNLTSQKIVVGDDKIVKVNKTIIVRSELEKVFNEVNKLGILYGKTFTKKEVLQTMIDEELLKNEVRNKSIVLDENQVNQEIQIAKEQYKQMMSQQKPNFVYDEKEFRAYLQKEGNISYENFVERIKDKVLVKQYIMKRIQSELQKIDQKQYTEAELKKFRSEHLEQFVQPESVEVKHIFLRTVGPDAKPIPGNEKEIVKKRALDILSRLRKGENFDELCLLNTEDIDSRDRKNPKTGQLDRGYIGIIPISGQGAEIAKDQFGFTQENLNYLYNLNKGQYSDIIESKYGIHIFLIVNKYEERIVPLEEARSQIIEYMKYMDKQKLFMDEYQKVIKELRDKAEIIYFAAEFDPGKSKN